MEAVPIWQDPTEVVALVFNALIWAIRKERNSRVFENLLGDFSSIWDSFQFSLARWAKKDCMLSIFSFESLCCNLRSVLLSHENDPSF